MRASARGATWSPCMTAWRSATPSGVPPGSRVVTTSWPPSASHCASRRSWVDLPTPSPPSKEMKVPGELTRSGVAVGADSTGPSLARVHHPGLAPDLVKGPHHLQRVLQGDRRALGLAGPDPPGHLRRLVLEPAVHLTVVGPPGAVVAGDRERRRAVEVAGDLDPAVLAEDHGGGRCLGHRGGVQRRLHVRAEAEGDADLAVDAGRGVPRVVRARPARRPGPDH